MDGGRRSEIRRLFFFRCAATLYADRLAMRIALGLEYVRRAVHRLAVAGRRPRRAGRARAGARARSPTPRSARSRPAAPTPASTRRCRSSTSTPTRSVRTAPGSAASTRILPPDIAVRWAQPVAAEFHARFAASARHYTYLLVQRATRPALLAGRVGWYHRPLDVDAMREAARRARRDARFLRVPRRGVPGGVAGEDAVACCGRGRRRVRPLRFFGERVPPPHDPQHRRRARVRRSGQGARRPGSRISSPRATARAPRRPSLPTGCTLTGADYDAKWDLPPTSGAGASSARMTDNRLTMRTRVKICGITRVEDGLAAARARRRRDRTRLLVRHAACGDARESARDRGGASARSFRSSVSSSIRCLADVRATLAAVPLDLLQFHGHEAAEFCRGFGRPYVKAIASRGRSGRGRFARIRQHGTATRRGCCSTRRPPGVCREARAGRSTGARCRRASSSRSCSPAGLSAANVADAIRRVRPWAVDVSSGVEALDADGAPIKGIKDAARIAAFIEEVRNADD